MTIAPDFWKSKTTWTAIFATVAGASALLSHTGDPQTIIMGVVAAWVAAFHLDGVKKASGGNS